MTFPARTRTLLAWAPAISLGFTLPALLVPDGHLRSRRWRVVVATAVAGPVAAMVGGALASGRLQETVLPIPNPFGLAGVAGAVAGWSTSSACCCGWAACWPRWSV